jgi:hypothetical protein
VELRQCHWQSQSAGRGVAYQTKKVYAMRHIGCNSNNSRDYRVLEQHTYVDIANSAFAATQASSDCGCWETLPPLAHLVPLFTMLACGSRAPIDASRLAFTARQTSNLSAALLSCRWSNGVHVTSVQGGHRGQ